MSVTLTQGRLVYCVLALMLLLALLMPAAAFAQNETVSCMDCHSEVCEVFHKTSHGSLDRGGSTTAGNACESCHGPGTAHAASGDPALIVNPSKDDMFGKSELCLNCHKGPQFDEWSFSAHKSGDLNCSSCHKVHADKPSVLRQMNADLCYSCHGNVRAASFMPSHHPVAEGKVDCVDCHNPHGGNVRLASDGSARELCFGCHADKEGPFVYEHAPVNEDCMICHLPHGSVADNLLKQTEPALCLSCHSMHFHASVAGVDGDFSVPLDPSRNGTSTSDGWKLGMLTKCTQCHTVIHGTDHPSQALSTGGNALTR